MNKQRCFPLTDYNCISLPWCLFKWVWMRNCNCPRQETDDSHVRPASLLWWIQCLPEPGSVHVLAVLSCPCTITSAWWCRCATTSWLGRGKRGKNKRKRGMQMGGNSFKPCKTKVQPLQLGSSIQSLSTEHDSALSQPLTAENEQQELKRLSLRSGYYITH